MKMLLARKQAVETEWPTLNNRAKLAGQPGPRRGSDRPRVGRLPSHGRRPGPGPGRPAERGRARRDSRHRRPSPHGRPGVESHTTAQRRVSAPGFLELRLVKWIVGAALAGAGLVIAAVRLFGG